MPRIIPNLWFDTEAEAAAELYCSVFPNSRITNVTHYGSAGPREAGMVLTVDVDLDGMPLTLLNGGPEFTPDEAFSFLVEVEDQDELDRYWDALLAGGGRESMCGWLKDRFGVSWQISPKGLEEFLRDPEDERGQRAVKAFLGMKKLDIAAIWAAADGAEATAGT